MAKIIKADRFLSKTLSDMDKNMLLDLAVPLEDVLPKLATKAITE